MLKKKLQYEYIFLFTIPKTLKTKQRVCSVLPGYMQKVKKPMDLCMKKALAKFSCKSKSFATLAEDINICIVWKTSATSKSCLLQQKQLNKSISYWEGLGKHSKQYIWVLSRKVVQTCARRQQSTFINKPKQIYFSTWRKH